MDSGHKSYGFGRRALKPCLAFLGVLVLGLSLTLLTIQQRLRLEELTMERLIIDKSIKITETISALMAKTQALAALVIQNNGIVGDFERVAATLADDPSIHNLLLAPDGVVQYVYPLTNNEGVLGYNLLSDGPGNKEARQAMETGQLVFGGPFNLVQGGQALVGRLPVWFADKHTGEQSFWGVVSVTLKYPEVLRGAGLSTLGLEGFAYEIWRTNPDDGQRQVIASNTEGTISSARHMETHIPILNANWYFRLMPVRAWHEYPEHWMMIVATLFVSLAMAVITHNNTELRTVKITLEEMLRTDPLTGIRNRTGFFYEFRRMLRYSSDFVLYYIDFNSFKQINDEFGHNIGDFVLEEFCRRVGRHAGKHRYLSRLSGDEFALLWESGKTPPEARETEEKAFWKAVSHEFERPIYEAEGKTIVLSFSMGKAVYPADGNSIDALLSCADSRMYHCKNAWTAACRQSQLDSANDASTREAS